VLQSAEEAISHNRRFVLKSDTKLTHHFVCDLSTGVSALTTITAVLKGDKLLKTSHQNFQFVVQRDSGITPLVYGHVNPYGNFRLDLHSRLPIDPPRFGPLSVGTQLLLGYDQHAG
jgi:hypothetical protein